MNSSTPLSTLYRSLSLILLTSLMLSGCATIERFAPRHILSDGVTLEVTRYATTKKGAVKKALAVAVTEAAPIKAKTETVTHNGQFKYKERKTQTEARLIDYQVLDHSTGLRGHKVTVEATFTYNEAQSLSGAIRQAEAMADHLGRTEEEQPVAIGRAIEYLADYQEQNRKRMLQMFEGHFRGFTTTDTSHVRRVRFQALAPIEARIYANPKGISHLQDLGVVAEVANDLTPDDQEDYEHIGHDRWFVDTTFIGISPWSYSPNMTWLMGLEIGRANYYTGSYGDEEDGEGEPTLEEAGLPEESGASPYLGVSVEHLRPSGWGVHYTGRYIRWRDGAPDIYQRVTLFREWYEPFWLSVGDIRVGLGWTSTDGGILDEYDALAFQVGWVF